MTIEKLTESERECLLHLAGGGVAENTLRIIDAQAAQLAEARALLAHVDYACVPATGFAAPVGLMVKVQTFLTANPESPRAAAERACDCIGCKLGDCCLLDYRRAAKP